MLWAMAGARSAIQCMETWWRGFINSKIEQTIESCGYYIHSMLFARVLLLVSIHVSSPPYLGSSAVPKQHHGYLPKAFSTANRAVNLCCSE